MMQSPGGLPPVHPIDEGFSWMVCLGAFGINLIANGGIRSTGILFIEVLELFKADKSLTALTMGLMAFGFAVFSAIGNAIGSMTSMRLACLIGAVLSFIGMFCTCIAKDIVVVVLSLGLLSGIGYGFMLGPCLVTVGQYFVKRRALATGLACGGGSVGTLIIPLFLQFTIDKYGFRGAVLIYAGIVLHAIPSAMLLRPTTFYDIKRSAASRQISSVAVVSEHSHKQSNNNSNQPLLQASPDLLPAAAATAASSKAAVVSNGADTSSSNSRRVDKAARYKLVGSRLIPDSSHTPHFEEAATQQPDSDDVVDREQVSVANPAPRPLQSKAPSNQPVADSSPAGPPPPQKMTCSVVMRTFVQRLFDRDLMHSYVFLLFTLGLSLGQAGYMDVCLFLPPYAVEHWKSKHLAAWLITVLGIADLFGRAGGGWFADLGLVRKPLLVGFSFLVVGVATIILPFFGSYVIAVAYAIVLGALGGTYQALIVVVVAELFGMAKLAAGVGLSSFFMGVSILPLPSLLGKLHSVTGSYDAAIRVSGVLLVLAGVACYWIPLMQRKDAQRKAAAAVGGDGNAAEQPEQKELQQTDSSAVAVASVANGASISNSTC